MELKNETTPREMVDPDLSGFHLTGHNLLLRPITIGNKTKSGVLLADQTQHDVAYLMNVAKVLKIGPTAYTQSMFELPNGTAVPWCKKGDFVLLPRLVGQKIKFRNLPLILVSCDKILAVLDNPEDIDPSFNLSTESMS